MGTCKMGGPRGSVPGKLLGGRALGGLVQEGLLLVLRERAQQRQRAGRQQLD